MNSIMRNVDYSRQYFAAAIRRQYNIADVVTTLDETPV